MNKMHYMIFSKKKRDLKMNIVIDGQAIDEVKKTKFLGVMVDSKLNWKEHNCIILFILYPCRSHCNHIWGSTYKTNLTKLATLQNKAIRIISQMNAWKNCDAMYNELGTIKFLKINKYLIGRFMFRVYHGQVPDFFSPFLEETVISINMKPG